MKEISYKWNIENLDSLFHIKSYDNIIEDKFQVEESSGCEGIKNGFYGKTHTEETKQKISNKIKNLCKNDENFIRSRANIGEKNGMYGSARYGSLNPMWGKTHSEETKDKQRQKRKEWYKNNENGNKGKKISDTRKKEISKRNSKKYKLISPEGEVIDIVNLTQFAKDNNLSIGCLQQVVSGRNKAHRGWKKYV
jgi:hypothetical protein